MLQGISLCCPSTTVTQFMLSKHYGSIVTPNRFVLDGTLNCSLLSKQTVRCRWEPRWTIRSCHRTWIVQWTIRCRQNRLYAAGEYHDEPLGVVIAPGQYTELFFVVKTDCTLQLDTTMSHCELSHLAWIINTLNHFVLWYLLLRHTVWCYAIGWIYTVSTVELS